MCYHIPKDTRNMGSLYLIAGSYLQRLEIIRIYIVKVIMRLTCYLFPRCKEGNSWKVTGPSQMARHSQNSERITMWWNLLRSHQTGGSLDLVTMDIRRIQRCIGSQ